MKINSVLKIYILYLTLTLFMFLFGPIEYEYVKKFEVFIFMTVFLLVSTFAFKKGASKDIKNPRKRIFIGNMQIQEKNVLVFCIVYACILQWMLIVFNASVYGISISKFFSMNFFQQMAQTYTDVEIVNTIPSWFMSYTGWAKIVAIVGGIYYYNNLKKYQKVMMLGVILGIIVNVVLFVGSQKQLVDLFIYIMIPVFLKNIVSGKKIKISKKVAIIIIIVLAVIIMGNNVLTRYELWSTRYNSRGLTSGTVNYDHWLYVLFPGRLGMGLTYFISYLSQGYRGLSLCLQIPFEWAYGMGSSFKLMNDISRWFSIPLSTLEVSYPVRMERYFNVKAYANWHSIFPWIASDYTWGGAIIVVSIFVYYWAKSLKEFLTCENLVALIMFVQLSVLVLYIPCNNQLFQTRESIVATLAIFISWFLFHGRRENMYIGEE